MKADQERVKTLLTDTVTLLCKNGLQFTEELKVQGLLGITLDNNDVFVVHINEIFKGLVGGQVSGIHAEETSAIAAADSATSDLNLKVKKSFPPNYPSPSPVGSAKRKAWTGTSSPAVKVKKEVMDEDLMIIDSKCFDHGDFNTVDDLSGDGDREAMRKSYGEVAQTQQTAPPPKWRVPDSASESFVDSQSQLSGTFSACLMKNESSKTPEGEDTLGDSSLDESRLSGIGQISEGQITYDSAPGCSGWESQVPGPSQVTSGESGSQDSHDARRAGQHSDSSTQLMWPTYLSPTGRTLPELTDAPLLGGGPTRRRRVLFRRDSKCPNKPYRCQFPGCEKAFYRGPERNRHQRLKHGGLFGKSEAEAPPPPPPPTFAGTDPMKRCLGYEPERLTAGAGLLDGRSPAMERGGRSRPDMS